MVMDQPYGIEEIADRLAIQDVLSRYVHALDSREIDVLDDVFTPDADFDLSQAGGKIAPWREIKKYFEGDHQRRFELDFHLFSNIKIEFAKGRDTATTRSKVFNPRGTRQPDGSLVHSIAVGFYEDEWVRTPDGWRVKKRTWYRSFAWDTGEDGAH